MRLIAAQPLVCSINLAHYQQEMHHIELFALHPTVIAELIIEADIPYDDDLPALIGIKKGDMITVDQLKKVIFYLAQKNKFKTVNLILEADLLRICLQSYWTFDRVKIAGFMVGKNIYKQLYAMRPGDQFSQERHHYSCERIKKYLNAQGYCDAIVYDECSYDEKRKSVVVTVSIKKGERFKVNAIKISSHAHILWPYIKHFVGKKYIKEDIYACIEQAKGTLFEHGFYMPDVTINEHINSAKKIVDLEVIIDSFAQRKFSFAGNQFFTKEKLLAQIELLGKSAWVLPCSIVAHVLQDEYKKMGFIDAVIRAEESAGCCRFIITEGSRVSPIIPEEKKQPEPVAVKNEIPRYFFGNTILQNGSTLPPHIMLRELAYKEGDPWQYASVKETLDRLNALEIFDDVQLTPVQNPLLPGIQTMILKTHADDPYEVRLRAGVGLQQMSKNFIFKNVSYVAGGAFLMKNPFNRADQFRIDADYTHGEQTISVQYIYPWLFGLPIKNNFEIYATQYLQPGLRHNQKNLYNFVQQGFTIGTNYARGIIDAQLNTGIEWMETTVVDRKHHPILNQEITHALNFEPLLVDKKIPYVLIEPSLVLNRTNNKLNPTSGSLSMLSLKGMFPLRLLSLNSFFVKIYFDQAVYMPIYNFVLAMRARVGHIFYKDFKNVMPAERFYLGGANSIRSYETDMCPPLGTFVNDEGKICFVPQGAKSMINLNAELRIPVYTNVVVALFQDLGALSNNHFADIKRHDILAGTGFGVRYNTPIGPLRFDFAFKWHRPDPAISRYCWFLSFGNAF